VGSTAFVREKLAPGVRPLAWMLSLQDSEGGALPQPCGLVCAFPPNRALGTELEFLVWLRGPYRNLGAGRQCLRGILADLIGDLRRPPLGQPRAAYRLLAYYPDGGANRAERLQKAMWMNFFFDHQFRSVMPDDPSALPDVITLARQIGS